MKIKTTQKEIKNNYRNIIHIGYCNIQTLLNCKKPNYYTCGVYGWNSDIYHINDNTCIVTGYRPFGNISVDYEVQNKFEEKARQIYYDYKLDYSKRIKKLEKLLDKFVTKSLERGVNDV